MDGGVGRAAIFETLARASRRVHRAAPRKLREGDRLLNEGRDITEVVRHLEIAEST